MNSTNAYLLLGSNLDNRMQQLENAIERIKSLGIIKQISSLYETEAWGNEDQPMFLNQAVHLSTMLDPEQLLDAVKTIEKDLGRQDDEKWQPRRIDIDILGMDDIVMESDKVTVPHPQLHLRNFAMIPLLDIAPDWIHPVLQRSAEELYMDCKDEKEVFVFEES